MTPPPSSQVPDHRQASTPLLRASTPTPSVLSSPPPTIVNGHRRDPVVGRTYIKPSGQDIAEASIEELRDMLKGVLAENSKLDIAAREARMSAAHYKLQHNLLSIETEEATKRMEVEHDMTRREVEILQRANQGFGDSNLPTQDFLAKLKDDIRSLGIENSKLSRRLERAKKIIDTKDDQLVAFQEEKRLLLTRIKENREHLNRLRSPGGIFHFVANSPKVSNSYSATPQQYRATPKHTSMTGRSVRQGRDHSQEPFAALLLADRVLHQENNSAPSTPIVSHRPDPRTPSKHSRGVQSLSSLPTTPGSARPGTANSTLLPSVQFTPQGPRTTDRGSPIQQSRQRERRRKSRDSTISASDAEEMARATRAYREESEEEVRESQASSKATEMLRKDPRESFEVASSRATTPTQVAEKSGLLQSKLLGMVVTKPTSEKRKRSEDSYAADYSSKKPRAERKAIGLGIGFEA